MDGIVIVALSAVLLGLAALLSLSLLRTRREMKRFDILNQIAHVTDRGGSLQETLDATCEIIVPAIADFCAIDLIRGGRVERIAARVGPGGSRATVERLAERRPSLPVGLKGGEARPPVPPRFFRRMTEADLDSLAHDAEDLEFLRGLGIRSAITVPLTARGRVTGALTVGVAWSGRGYDDDDAEFAGVLSGRVALTLENAGLFSDLERAERARAEIAQTLQRGLLPPPLPHVPGWSIAASYRPAGAENEVGGDFYDAFPAAGGWMLVVGDVTGRGASAASVTAQARYTLRTAAALTGDPLVALATLNRALLGRGDSALCSVVALAIDEDAGRPVRIAAAGHAPPLLVDGEEVREVGRSGPVLGAFADARWDLDQVAVEEGQHLVVATDGIAEACGEEGRFGEDRLVAELAGLATPVHVVQRLDGALQAFLGGDLQDDVAVLGLAPVDASRRSPDEGNLRLVERLFDAFNRRDSSQVGELCDEEMEFYAVTAREIGRSEPYVGWDGLRSYLDDVARVWEELLISPREVEERDGELLVLGRVYLRSRPLGIRDMPAGWIWSLRDGRFCRGEVFVDPEAAVSEFNRAAPRGPNRDRDASRSMTRLP